jgi:hypothetical protein
MYRPANPAAITTASKFWVPTGVTMVEKQAVTPAGKVDRAGAWQWSIAICGCGDPVEFRILGSVEVTVGRERTATAVSGPALRLHLEPLSLQQAIINATGSSAEDAQERT